MQKVCAGSCMTKIWPKDQIAPHHLKKQQASRKITKAIDGQRLQSHCNVHPQLSSRATMNQCKRTGTTQNAVRKEQRRKSTTMKGVKIKVENHNVEAKKEKKKKEAKTTQAGRTSPQIKAIEYQIVLRNDPKPSPDTLKT